MYHTPEDVIKGLDKLAENKQKKASDNIASLASAAAALIRKQEVKIGHYLEIDGLVCDLLGNLRPEITARLLSTLMRGPDGPKAVAARDMAQFFIETHDAIGDLLDRPALDYDRIHGDWKSPLFR